MTWIYDLSHDELIRTLEDSGIKKFVSDQIFQWMYQKNTLAVEKWTNISRQNRIHLKKSFNTGLNRIIKTVEDSDGTRKFLYKLSDGLKIESVLMVEKNHFTFCISTQVGCPLGCRFCATGKMGFRRNLTSGEILSQILAMKSQMEPPEKKINLVFMGMGEPFLNYPNVKKALKIIVSPKGMKISPRRVTVSTAGILEGIREFEKDFPNAKLSFSLNAADVSTRESLMPVSKKEPLEDILKYFRKTKRKHRITFEYVLLDRINDFPGDAKKLTSLIHGISSKINIIPFNPSEEGSLMRPPEKRIQAFWDILYKKGHTVTIRWSKGPGIKSSCGQLATDND
jgi:23S rRNA (adenine2503-C2)-methyltransferase